MHSPEQLESGVMQLDGTREDKTWSYFVVFGGDVCSDRDDGGGSGSAAAAAKASDTNHNGHQVFDGCPMRSTCS